MKQFFPLRVFLGWAFLCVLSWNILFAQYQPSSDSLPHFKISRSQLEALVKELAPKVGLFQEVWSRDPQARFFGGTARDFIYWILKHFEPRSKLSAEAVIESLRSTPLIDSREFLSMESDLDVLTTDRQLLVDLQGSDFGIRKIDLATMDRLDPHSKLGKNEVEQGYISVEKMVLSHEGIVHLTQFKDALEDLVTGHFHLEIPDPVKFWNSYYAKKNANHPILLALRFIRLMAQDFRFRRIDADISVHELVQNQSSEVIHWIKATIEGASNDPQFLKFIQNESGKRWMAGSIQKAFRSFTDPTIAFELFKYFGVDRLQIIFKDEIPSLHDYLFRRPLNEKSVRENWGRVPVSLSEANVLQNPRHVFRDGFLYHGAGSDLAFRSLIFQGIQPSTRGNAGEGLYGVPFENISVARRFSQVKGGSEKLVVKLEVKPQARIVDISQGSGMNLFEWWKKNTLNLKKASESRAASEFDLFTDAFGIDILVYPYDSPAVVVKNPRSLGKAEGVDLQLLTLKEILKRASDIKDYSGLKELLQILEQNKLTLGERDHVLSKIPDFTIESIITSSVLTDSNLPRLSRVQLALSLNKKVRHLDASKRFSNMIQTILVHDFQRSIHAFEMESSEIAFTAQHLSLLEECGDLLDWDAPWASILIQFIHSNLDYFNEVLNGMNFITYGSSPATVSELNRRLADLKTIYARALFLIRNKAPRFRAQLDGTLRNLPISMSIFSVLQLKEFLDPEQELKALFFGTKNEKNLNPEEWEFLKDYFEMALHDRMGFSENFFRDLLLKLCEARYQFYSNDLNQLKYLRTKLLLLTLGRLPIQDEDLDALFALATKLAKRNPINSVGRYRHQETLFLDLSNYLRFSKNNNYSVFKKLTELTTQLKDVSQMNDPIDSPLAFNLMDLISRKFTTHEFLENTPLKGIIWDIFQNFPRHRDISVFYSKLLLSARQASNPERLIPFLSKLGTHLLNHMTLAELKAKSIQGYLPLNMNTEDQLFLDAFFAHLREQEFAGFRSSSPEVFEQQLRSLLLKRTAMACTESLKSL